MATTTQIAEEFMSLFTGLDRAYGTYNATTTKENGKKVGEGKDIQTVKAPVTRELWEAHIAGKQRIGIVPIRDGNDCAFGAIDVDQYSGINHQEIAKKVMRNKLPLAVCRSKSGGAHIYCFSKFGVPAATMKSKLTEVAGFLGFGGSEVFPKQVQLVTEKGDCGQWINMPYFGGVRGMCYCVDVNGDAMSPDQFVRYAHHLMVESDWFTQLLVMGNDFSDGPPCLQTLAQTGIPEGMRNDGLFAIGTYLKKAMPDTWQQELDNYNHQFIEPPLGNTEVQGVLKSLLRKEYVYACTRQPLAQHCNSALCRTRTYGVGSNMSSKFPSLGALSKLNTKPAIWFWSINEKRVEFITEDLQDPKKFQRKCMEHLNVMPIVPAMPAWQAAVNAAMENVVVIEAPADASAEGQFWELAEKFLNGRAQAFNMEEILLGKPYTTEGKTYFRMADLLSFLSRLKFNEFKAPKIASMLQDAGAEHAFKTLKGRGTNYWIIDAVAKQAEGHQLPKDILQNPEEHF